MELRLGLIISCLRFVDHDMFICFTGGGIGHLSMQESTQGFEDKIQGLWGTVAVPAPTDNSDSDNSNNDSDLNVQLIDAQQLTAAGDGANSNPKSDSELLDLEDATFVSYEDEMLLGEEADSEA